MGKEILHDDLQNGSFLLTPERWPLLGLDDGERLKLKEHSAFPVEYLGKEVPVRIILGKGRFTRAVISLWLT